MSVVAEWRCMALSGSLDATVESDAVRFSFAVTNEGSDPVEASFSDAQRVDCTVTDGGEAVWGFSDGRMFAMMMGSETFQPGDTETYEMEWEDPQSGTFDARAELVANDATCEASTTLTV